MDNGQAERIANRYGYSARSAMGCWNITPQRSYETLAQVSTTGQIIPYSDDYDAQCHMACRVLADEIWLDVALLTLPLPCPAETWRFRAGRLFSSLWRKSSKHLNAMLSLEEKGLVERKVCRGETLWRPTNPDGLAARTDLQAARAGA